MGNASEVVREVGINDFRVASEQQPVHLDHRLLGISPRTVRVLFGWKVGFKDRFQHQHRCCHADPIPHGRDAQWPELAVGLRDKHSSDGPRLADLSLAGVRLVIADLALGRPVLRTLSLCTCRRQYPGVATGRTLRSTRPAISAFPDMAVGSAYTSSFSRLARRSLALRPAHSRCH
jgi:hypothetical protein